MAKHGDEYVDWDEMFGTPCAADLSQPVISVPMCLFEADRDEIVTAARKYGFMRVLTFKDPANAHFCRYV